jgi:chaperonin GroEL (HSP60 family)
MEAKHIKDIIEVYASVYSKPEEIVSEETLEEKKIAEEKMIFVEMCENPKAVGILIRGGTEHVVDELDRDRTRRR